MTYVEDENENNDTRGIAATTGETTLDADVFRDLSRESPVKFSHSTSIIMRNDDTAKERERLLKTTGRILETVPKSYRARARLLMKYLHDKAVPTRISWNDDGIVTIDGNVVKDSNIADLINDAMRERKTTRAAGRAQFARLLRALRGEPALEVSKNRFFRGFFWKGKKYPIETKLSGFIVIYFNSLLKFFH